MCGAASMATTSPADVCPLLLMAIAAYACCGSRRPGMGGRDRCGPSRPTSHHHHFVVTDVTTDRSEMSSHVITRAAASGNDCVHPRDGSSLFERSGQITC